LDSLSNGDLTDKWDEQIKKFAGLSEYRKKRKFDKTPEPEGKKEGGENKHRFVIQEHMADKAGRHLDLRLENDSGTLSSWAIPKAKLPKGDEKLLAKKTEDHPIEYMKFSGEIDEGYGKGKVKIWASGKYKEVGWGRDKIVFEIDSGKAKGKWALIKTDRDWLLIKHK
jgi:bifunctional non-homologous end joining protein LigD